MSTRANIIIKDEHEKLFFYRHSDGYPEGTMPTLELFLKWVKEGKIRNNVNQCSGWLILIGAMEYATIPKHTVNEDAWPGGRVHKTGDEKSIEDPDNWRCGAYEPTMGIHGDVEYVYVIDLKAKEIVIHESWSDDTF